MDNQADKEGFSEILRKLEEKMLYYEGKASRQRKNVLNRINLEGFKAIQRKYTDDRSLCKIILSIFFLKYRIPHLGSLPPALARTSHQASPTSSRSTRRQDPLPSARQPYSLAGAWPGSQRMVSPATSSGTRCLR